MTDLTREFYALLRQRGPGCVTPGPLSASAARQLDADEQRCRAINRRLQATQIQVDLGQTPKMYEPAVLRLLDRYPLAIAVAHVSEYGDLKVGVRKGFERWQVTVRSYLRQCPDFTSFRVDVLQSDETRLY